MACNERASAILGIILIADFASICVIAAHPSKHPLSNSRLVPGCVGSHLRGGGKGDWASWFDSDSGDPNEPYIQEYSDSQEDDQLWLDSEDSENDRFDLHWSILRRKVLPIAREIEDRKLAKEAEERAAEMAASAAAAAAAAPPNVTVTFQLGVPHAKAPELVTSQGDFPVFKAALKLPRGLKLEFRYGIIRFQVDGDPEEQETRAVCQWEGLGRRLVVGAEDMQVWHSFKEDPQQYPRVTEQEYQSTFDLSTRQWVDRTPHAANAKVPCAADVGNDVQLTAQEWTRWMRHHMKVSAQGFVHPS